jgi:sporulation protein YlmC with PRC-barrel domain
MVGSDVYSSPGEDAEVVGSINDLVINAEGRIAAVVIGVGGFLGIGEKNVAVDFSQIQMTPAEDGSVRLVLPTTAEALTAAPDFVYPEDAEAEGDAAATDGAEAEGGDAAATDDAAANGMAAGGMAAGGMAAGGAAAGEQAAAGAGIDRSTLTPLDMSSVTAENLIGTAVYGANDEQVGTIGDFVMSADGGQIDAVIIDVGGFLGIGVKEVAVGFENLQFSTDENNNRYLFLNVTREQLDAQPAFNRDTFQTDRDAQLLTAS